MSDAPSTPAAPAMGAMGAMCPAGACGVARQAAGVLEVESWEYFPWRIHGAAICGNMDPINIPPMLAYIAYMDHMGFGIPELNGGVF